MPWRGLLADMLIRSELKSARLGVAIGSLAWAAFLLGAQFDRPVYAELRALAPQGVWCFLFSVVGLVQLWRVYIGAQLESGALLYVSSGLIALLWLVATIAVLRSLWPPPALAAGDVAVTFLALLVFVRAVARRD